MPTYQYYCTECGHELEAVQKFSEDSLTVCPNCEGLLRKRFNAVGVVFKGSGFYSTDYRKQDGNKNTTDGADSGSNGDGGKNESGDKSDGSDSQKTPSEASAGASSSDKSSSDSSGSAGSSGSSSSGSGANGSGSGSKTPAAAGVGSSNS